MTHAEKMLAAIEAVLEGRVDSDVEAYEIAGRKITKIPIAELVQLRTHYQAEVATEKVKAEVKAGLGNRRTIKTRLS